MTATLPSPTTRPREIELPSNLYVYHRLSDWLLPRAVAWRIPANLISLTGLSSGALAAFCYFHWQDWHLAVAGWLLMMAWHVCDGLDGSVARATGTASAFGRFIDGFSDYGVFVLVYLALVASLPQPLAMLPLALAAGAAHAAQSALYEAIRGTYVRRVAGRFEAAVRDDRGNRLEALYNRAEALLGNRTSALDLRLQALAPSPRANLLARWQQAAIPCLRLLGLLASNGRTTLILLACLAGNPAVFWWTEFLLMSLVAIAGALWWQRIEAAFGAEGQRDA
jgi:phosphatidylglycerophosphate synthase